MTSILSLVLLWEEAEIEEDNLLRIEGDGKQLLKMSKNRSQEYSGEITRTGRARCYMSREIAIYKNAKLMSKIPKMEVQVS